MMNEFLAGLVNLSLLGNALLVLKFTIFVGCILVCHRIFDRSSASLKHTVLGLGVLGCLALLGLHFFVPNWNLELPAIQTAANEASKVCNSHSVTEPLPVYECPTNDDQESLSPDSSQAAELQYAGQGYSWQSPALANEPTNSNLATSNQNESESEVRGFTSISLPTAFAAIWFAIATLLLIRLVFAWVWVAKLIRVSSRMSDGKQATYLPSSLRNMVQKRRVRLFVADNDRQMPLGFGLVRKSILLPSSCRDWSAAQWQAVLQHEIAHFDRRDCWVNLAARLQQALFWFHPLATTLVRKLREESELACDDRVIEAGVPRADYASVLLQFASCNKRRNTTELVAVSMADSVPLENRMVSILNDKASRRPASFGSVLALFVVGSVLLIPVATASVLFTTKSATIATEPTGVEPVQEFAEEQAMFNVSLQPTGDEVSYGGEFLGAPTKPISIKTTDGEKQVDIHDLRQIRQIGRGSKKFEVQTTDNKTFVGELSNDEFLNFEIARSISGEHGDEKRLDPASIYLVTRLERAEAKPGEVTEGTTESKLRYHLRVPRDFDLEKPTPALILLPQNNGYSKTYVEEFVECWPEIAERYILIGLNGERPLATSSEDTRYEFTALSYVGKGTRWGPLAGTDRESPILIAEAISQFRDQYEISSVYVAGLGMSGFCAGGVNAIQIHSFFPQLVDGVIAMNAAVLIQCVPRDFKDPVIMKQQRETPLVFLEVGKPQSKHQYSDWAYKSYRSCGFPMVNHLVRPQPKDSAKGPLSRYAMEQAIEWLEAIKSKNPANALQKATDYMEAENYRQAITMLNLINRSQLDPQQTISFDAASKKISELTKNKAIEFQKRLKDQKHGDWVDEYNEFQLQFDFAPLAKSSRELFYEMRQQHEQPARDLIKEASKLAKADPTGDSPAVKEKYKQIIEKYFASTQYRIANERLNPKK